MLQAIEAIIETNGTVHLLESIQPKQRMRAIITLLEPIEPQDNSKTVLALLQSPDFQNIPASHPDAIEAIIQENRNAWDE
jgi:hypothetical protein